MFAELRKLQRRTSIIDSAQLMQRESCCLSSDFSCLHGNDNNSATTTRKAKRTDVNHTSNSFTTYNTLSLRTLKINSYKFSNLFDSRGRDDVVYLGARMSVRRPKEFRIPERSCVRWRGFCGCFQSR